MPFEVLISTVEQQRWDTNYIVNFAVKPIDGQMGLLPFIIPVSVSASSPSEAAKKAKEVFLQIAK
jgi:hypothetical protein